MNVWISIAGMSLGLDSKDAGKARESYLSTAGLDEIYDPFIVSAPDDVSILLRRSGSLQGKRYNRVFDSSALWALHFNSRNDFRLEFKKGFQDPALAFVDVDLIAGEGTIFYTEEGIQDPATGFLPFVQPVDGVIFINLLPSCQGILLHACGINDNGRGFVLPGRSGDGKSTTARLWRGEAGATVLSDERIIVREIKGRFYACGTPWHGEEKVFDAGNVELEKIFFLQHAKHNYVMELPATDAAARMFVRSVPPFWDGEGLGLTLSLISKIVSQIPCYELGFVPDKSAITFVRNIR